MADGECWHDAEERSGTKLPGGTAFMKGGKMAWENLALEFEHLYK
jgi:hypothetical protein